MGVDKTEVIRGAAVGAGLILAYFVVGRVYAWYKRPRPLSEDGRKILAYLATPSDWSRQGGIGEITKANLRIQVSCPWADVCIDGVCVNSQLTTNDLRAINRAAEEVYLGIKKRERENNEQALRDKMKSL